MKLNDEAATRSYVMRERARTTAETGVRIVGATIELFAELPYSQLTLARVAERAGVTVQTVIRRFGDKEGLIAAAAAHANDSVSAQRGAAPVGDLRGIVENLVSHYEAAGGIAMRLLAEEESSPTIAAITHAGRAYHRDWCLRVFAPWLVGLRGVARERRVAQLVAVCDVYTWKLLRRDAGLSRTQTRTALLELLEPLTRKA
jgi:AcrR family transcriptional regulator